MLLHIITYYWISLHIWVLQLDFIAEGDVRGLEHSIFTTYRLALTINHDSHSKDSTTANEEPRPTVPDVVWAQDKPFDPGWASEDDVL